MSASDDDCVYILVTNEENNDVLEMNDNEMIDYLNRLVQVKDETEMNNDVSVNVELNNETECDERDVECNIVKDGINVTDGELQNLETASDGTYKIVSLVSDDGVVNEYLVPLEDKSVSSIDSSRVISERFTPIVDSECDKEENMELIETYVSIMKQQMAPPLDDNVYTVKDTQYCCGTCEFVCGSRSEVVRHYRDRHGEKYLQCLACGSTYRNTTALYKHERRCKAPNAKLVVRARQLMIGLTGRAGSKAHQLFKCNLCKRYYNRADIKQHNRSHGVPLKCSLCPATFKVRKALESHERHHAGVRPFTCEYCSNTYTNKAALQRHRQSHMSPRFVCPECGREFHRVDSYSSHMKIHLPGGTPTHQCGQCDKSFSKMSDLNIHRRVHLGLPKPYACDICSKSFIRMSILKDHMKKIHDSLLITKKMFYNMMARSNTLHGLNNFILQHENIQITIPSTVAD